MKRIGEEKGGAAPHTDSSPQTGTRCESRGRSSCNVGSRMRVELSDRRLKQQRSSTRRWRQSVEKDMQTIRNELSGIILAIDTEHKRNALLDRLNDMLKLELRGLGDGRPTQRSRGQPEDKILRKTEYDIEQILQRSNEEVAKINQLREETASVRSERVVYSDLFKKIEKEIQQHEALYQKLIIDSERILAHPHPTPTERSIDMPEEVQYRGEEGAAFHHHVHSYDIAIPENYLFLTNPHERSIHCQRVKLSHRAAQSCRPTQHTGSLIEIMISELQAKISKTVKLAQCDSSSEAVIKYAALEQQNQDLFFRIEDEELAIEYLEDELKKMKKKQRSSEADDSWMPVKTEEMDAESGRNRQFFQEIVALFGIEREERKSGEMHEDFYQEIELKVDGLVNRKGKLKTQTSLYLNEPNLEAMLLKMQRFEWSDKIMNKRQLQNEYQREITKTKRTLRKK